MKYKIKKCSIRDSDLGATKTVESPGILEAMLEYLPWPTIQVKINYSPCNGRARVIDEMTGFQYDVEIGAAKEHTTIGIIVDKSMAMERGTVLAPIAYYK